MLPSFFCPGKKGWVKKLDTFNPPQSLLPSHFIYSIFLSYHVLLHTRKRRNEEMEVYYAFNIGGTRNAIKKKSLLSINLKGRKIGSSTPSMSEVAGEFEKSNRSHKRQE